LIGIFGDSNGDLRAFGAAYQLLRQKGARRFFFPGGRYADLDDWIDWLKTSGGGADRYSNADFLDDVSNFLESREQLARPPVFDQQARDPSQAAELDRLKEKFVRTPERESIHYGQPAVGTKVVDMLGDVLCCIVHDKNDLNREDLLNASVFFHGKGLEPKVVQIGPRYFITPGQLTGAIAQTCALVELAERNLRFSAFTLDGRTVVDGELLELHRKSKLSVK